MPQINVVFSVVRSFRESNIDVHIDVFIAELEEVVRLFFEQNHVHYARGVSVFIVGLKKFHLRMTSLYTEFKDGRFVVNTGGNTGNTAINQVQEHITKRLIQILDILIK